MNFNKEVVSAQISAMRFTDSDIASDYQAISNVTHNGRHFSTWDRRFQILCDKLAKNPRYQQLIIPRGLWTFVATLDKDDSKLYVMMTEKNLSTRRHEVKMKGFSTHYGYSLIFINKGIETDSKQLEMIPDDKNQERRVKDLEKMLGEWVGQVNEVLISSFEYDHDKIIGGSISLFDDNYRQVERVDLSDQILHPIKKGDVQSSPDVVPQSQEPIVKMRTKRRSQEDKEKKEKRDNSDKQ